MVCHRNPQPISRRNREGYRSRDAFLVRYPCAARVLWPRLPARNLPDARRASRPRGNAGLFARNQCACASHGKSVDGGASAAASFRDTTIRATRQRACRGNPMTPIGNPDLTVSFAGIELKNPIIAASGTFGYGIEFEDIVHLDRLRGFVVKGLSKEPMTGNPPPRLFETAAGMLNAIGLQNIGARAFLEEKLPLLRKIDNIVFLCNVFCHSQDEYEDVVRMLNDSYGIAGYELNVSCPNTKCGGI